jgi:hypothetical protein
MVLGGPLDDTTLAVAVAGGVLVVAAGLPVDPELHAAASTSSPTATHQ